jgi:hypothetical protein
LTDLRVKIPECGDWVVNWVRRSMRNPAQHRVTACYPYKARIQGLIRPILTPHGENSCIQDLATFPIITGGRGVSGWLYSGHHNPLAASTVTRDSGYDTGYGPGKYSIGGRFDSSLVISHDRERNSKGVPPRG